MHLIDGRNNPHRASGKMIRGRFRRLACIAIAISSIVLLEGTAFAASVISRGPGMNTGPRMPGGDIGRTPTGPRFPGGGGPGVMIGVPGGFYTPMRYGPPGVVVTDDNDDPLPGRTRRASRASNRNSGPNRNTRNFAPPPPGERRFVANEVILDIAANVPDSSLDMFARQNRMTRLESYSFVLTGRRLLRFRINDRRSVATVIRGLSGDRRIGAAFPNYLYHLTQDTANAAAPAADPAQYTLGKLRVPEAHRLATGNNVLVAVIDSGIDETHPDLAGVVAGTYDALGAASKPHAHGTAMAGAIASRGKLMGVAPRVRILAIRAFEASSGGAEGTTFQILKGLDWAYAQGARVVNMSFAGPADPALERELTAARQKGAILIAAAGNAGPKSPPLYPAADPNVIAVTATDADDKVFSQANRGSYIAVAAPGVDIIVPAPEQSYQISSGTSVAAAHVSGVVALMMERNAHLAPDSVRKILTSTARPLGPKTKNPDAGAGLTDAYQAIVSAEPKTAGRSNANESRPR